MSKIQNRAKRSQQKEFAFYSPKSIRQQHQDKNFEPQSKDSEKRGFNSFIMRESYKSVSPAKKCDMSTPIINNERKESLQKMLVHFAAQNKKLIKERSSLFKKNCQLSQRIKKLETQQFDSQVRYFNQLHNSREYQNLNCQNRFIGHKSNTPQSQIKINELNKLGKLLSPTSHLKNNGNFNFDSGNKLQPVQQYSKASLINNQEEDSPQDLDETQKKQCSHIKFALMKSSQSSAKNTHINQSLSINANNLSRKQLIPNQESLTPRSFKLFKIKRNKNQKKLQEEDEPQTRININHDSYAQQSDNNGENQINFSSSHFKTQEDLDDLSTIQKKSTIKAEKSVYPKIVITPSSKQSPYLNFPLKLLKPSRQIQKCLQKIPSKVELPNLYKFTEQENRRLSMAGNNHPSPHKDNDIKRKSLFSELDLKLKKIRQQNYKLRQQLKF